MNQRPRTDRDARGRTGRSASLRLGLVTLSTRLIPASVLAVAVALPAIADEALPALRAELLTRAAVDQSLRMALNHASSKVDEAEWGRIRIVDVANTKRMHEVVERSGWPTRSKVGDDGSQAAWLLVQHADADHAFQHRCLDLMQAADRGEVSGESIALLTDRVRLAEGKKQLYGTQVRGDCTTGYALLPTEDEGRLDERRAQVGLPAFGEYLQIMSRNFCSTKSP